MNILNFEVISTENKILNKINLFGLSKIYVLCCQKRIGYKGFKTRKIYRKRHLDFLEKLVETNQIYEMVS